MRRLRSIRSIFAASAALAVSTAAHAGITLYVDDDGAPNGSGLDWDNCCRFLQEALQIAADPLNDVTGIRVAEGVYLPDRDEITPGGTGDRTATFQLLNGVALMGGYAGPGAADPDARDIDLYPTVLSGDLLGDDLPGFVNNAENSWHVVTGSGTDETAVMEGFTVTAGNADGPTYPPDLDSGGGGMINVSGSPTVDQCTFIANWAFQGCAGMFNFEASSPWVTDCVFEGNEATQTGDGSSGGGMCNIFDSHATVLNCEFRSNAAGWGGGMLNDTSHPVVMDCLFESNLAPTSVGGGMQNNECDTTITGCTFTGNTASHGGGMHNGGGSPTISDSTFSSNVANYGAGMRNYSSTPAITNCNFTANTANAQGGGMQNWDSSPTIDACTFVGNTAVGGGAIRNAGGSSPTVTHSSIVGNTVTGQGGGLSNDVGGDVSLTACIVSENQATRGGGMLNRSNAALTNCLITGNAAMNYGGAIDLYNGGEMTLINCTLVDNEAQFSGDSIRISLASSGTVVNSILWNPGDEIVIADVTSTAEVSYSNVEGGWVGDGNIDADPQFVDAANGDFHLVSGSAAIDAGHNWAVAPLADTDLEGSPRFADDAATADTGCGVPVIVDMGVYEFQGTPFAVKYGDMDGDGQVGIEEFLIVIGMWGPCTDECCLGDLDLDGEIGIVEFLIVIGSWDL